MIKEIDVLLLDINNKHIGCKLDEVEKVISDISGISGNTDVILPRNKGVYRLGDLLKIQGMVTYSSVLLLENELKKPVIIAIPAITDIVKLKTSKILAVPEYLRKKQDPFFVWGFFMNKNDITMLITFAYLTNAKVKDGYHEL
ncbi:MAG: hypothetical protein JXB88_21405 [Spirochaetales bacterium]|nr:hypothetical protein [Spirochaetales bacterium]